MRSLQFLSRLYKFFWHFSCVYEILFLYVWYSHSCFCCCCGFRLNIQEQWNQNLDTCIHVCVFTKENKKEANICFFHGLFSVHSLFKRPLWSEQILIYEREFRGSHSCSIWSLLTLVVKQFPVFDHHPCMQLSVPDNLFAEDQESPPLCFFIYQIQ